MKSQDNPFPLPRTTSPVLGQVREYWAGLKRGGNDIPFADDLRLTALPDLAKSLLVVDVFASPQRFRLSSVGDNWLADSHRDLAGRFLDEIEPGTPPLAFLLSQCAATVESGKPTWHAHRARERASATQPAFERLLLPLWGDGRISMIFGAIDRHRTASGIR